MIENARESNISVNSTENENSLVTLKESEKKLVPFKKSLLQHNDEREKYLLSILEYIPVFFRKSNNSGVPKRRKSFKLSSKYSFILCMMLNANLQNFRILIKSEIPSFKNI